MNPLNVRVEQMKNAEQTNFSVIVKNSEQTVKERSACGFRQRLLSKEDRNIAAWVHTVDIFESAKPHFHKRAVELYYVLEGEGLINLDGKSHKISKGSIIQIPPNVVHSASGKLKLLVVGIPDIAEDDIFYP